MEGVRAAITVRENASPGGSDDTSHGLAKRYRVRAGVLALQGQFADAEALLREALLHAPEDVDILNELGVAIWRQGRHAVAEQVFRQANELNPEDYRVLNNLGLSLYNQGRIDEAGECYRCAIELEPELFDALMNLGIVLSDKGSFEEATHWLEAAHELRPHSADILQNLGMNLGRQGRWHEAIDFYERALRQKPDFPEVHRNLGYARLITEDYARGWPEHEWRLRCEPYPGYKINRTFWNGDHFPNQTILLHAEQGSGDVLQFIRFAPMVKARGGTVLVLCPAPLLQLVARCNGVDMAFDYGTFEPRCDIQAPLLSLPSILGTTLETLPAHVPYLAIDTVLHDHWRAKIAELAATLTTVQTGDHPGRAAGGNEHLRPAKPYLVGIVWQGNPDHVMDGWRSIPLAQFEPLARIPGVHLISLQTHHGLEQMATARERFPLTEIPGRRGRNFMETAAILPHLDLVVTADTSIAHLAGALGLNVWVALSRMGEWRWHLDREDSPWYPTMRLFRQTTLGDWNDVFERMALRLGREIERA
jgi:Flp pilus assembly protein TadD